MGASRQIATGVRVALVCFAAVWLAVGLASGAGNTDSIPPRPSSTSAQWVVLPDSVRPLCFPRPDAQAVGKPLHYGDRVRGGLIDTPPGATSWLAIDGEAGYLPAAWVVLYMPLPEADLPVGKEKVDRVFPLSLDYKPSDLVEVPKRWHYHAQARHRLRRSAARAAVRMFEAARTDGVRLRVASTYRSAAQQRFLYLRKIARAGFDQNMVAKPGHSEHQLGTALDVTGLDPATALKQRFADTPEGRWLEANASRFGFRFSYPRDSEARTGYGFEPWHVRYMGLEAD